MPCPPWGGQGELTRCRLMLVMALADFGWKTSIYRSFWEEGRSGPRGARKSREPGSSPHGTSLCPGAPWSKIASSG